jgi:hypothetical protein
MRPDEFYVPDEDALAQQNEMGELYYVSVTEVVKHAAEFLPKDEIRLLAGACGVDIRQVLR